VTSHKRWVLAVAGIYSVALSVGCAASRPHASTPPRAKSGETLFQNYCAGCHIDNTGERSENPPLEGSSWVTGPETRLIKIVLHGVQGRIEVNGQTYNQEMPSFGPVLSDADIASLLSHVRRRFGGINTTITPAAVSAIRAANQNRTSYWTVDELLKDP
jgi:mono/diheme cytochrome c family protein